MSALPLSLWEIMASADGTPIIALIDDDDAVRESMRLLLEAFGYTIRDHSSAESFLASNLDTVDCLLVDQHMPAMTGVELLEHLHRNHASIPSLVVTGRPDQSVAARLSRIGIRMVSKPVPEEVLIAFIEEVCRPAKQQ